VKAPGGQTEVARGQYSAALFTSVTLGVAMVVCVSTRVVRRANRLRIVYWRQTSRELHNPEVLIGDIVGECSTTPGPRDGHAGRLPVCPDYGSSASFVGYGG